MTPDEAAAALLDKAGPSTIDAPPIDVLHLAEEVEDLDVQEHADLLTRLHCDGADPHTRFCRADEAGAGEAEAAAAQAIEREANRFAAALLMPERLVREEALKHRLNAKVLADRFGVSVVAMQVRLEGLRLMPDYMKRCDSSTSQTPTARTSSSPAGSTRQEARPRERDVYSAWRHAIDIAIERDDEDRPACPWRPEPHRVRRRKPR